MLLRLIEAFYSRNVTFRDVSVRWKLGAVLLKAALPQLPEPPRSSQSCRKIAHHQVDCHNDHSFIV